MIVWRDPWNNLRVGRFYALGLAEGLFVAFLCASILWVSGLLIFWTAVNP